MEWGLQLIFRTTPYGSKKQAGANFPRPQHKEFFSGSFMEEAAKKSKAEKFREWAQFVILIIAGIWAAYTFHFNYSKELQVQANRPASLVVTGSLEEIGRKSGLALVRAKVHVVNKREVKIFAPALWFTVTGNRFSAYSEQVPDDALRCEDGSLPEVFTQYSDCEPEVLAAWRLPGWVAWYEQDGESTHEQLFYVSVKKYHALQLLVGYAVARNIDQIASVEWKIEKGAFTPTILMKKTGFDKSHPQLVEAYDPVENQHHEDLMKQYGIGWENHISSLSFLPNSKAGRQVTP